MGIKLASETIPKSHIDALIEWLGKYPKLTKGEMTLELEERFAEKVGANYSVFVNSGSSANLLMISYLKHCLDDTRNNIIVPAISWSTDLAPIIQLGFNPILVDSNPMFEFSYSIDEVEFLFQKYKPLAFLAVSVLGFIGNIKQIKKLCDEYDVILIEDNCESLLSDGAGQYGLMSSYSTYYGHHISTIEGGFITTNDYRVYQYLLMLRSHGWTRDCDDYWKNIFKSYNKIDDFNENYTFYLPAYNVRNTEIGAYLGLLQLDILDNYCKIRDRNWRLWKRLVGTDTINTFLPEERLISNFALPLINLDNRDKVVKACKENDIECRPLISGSMSLQPVYKSYCSEIVYTPNANRCHDEAMYLPNHADISEKDVEFMADVVLGAIR